MKTRGISCLVAAIVLCACESSELTKVQPDIVVAPSIIEFDTVPWDSRTRRGLTISNRGDGVLSIDRLESSEASFSVAGAVERVMPSESVEVDVWFEAGSTGLGQAEIKIHSNDPDTPVLSVPVKATRRAGPVLAVCYEGEDIPVAHRCEASPAIDFGGFRINERRRVTVTIRSEGDAPLFVHEIVVEGEGFEVTAPSEDIELARGETQTFELSLTPHAVGETTGTLFIASNDASDPNLEIPLQGEGVESPLCIEPTVLDFGVIPLGETETRSLSLRNCGDDQMEVRGLVLSDGPFSTRMLGATSLPPGGAVSLDVEVTYTPRAEGRDSARLRLDTSAGPAFVDVLGGGARCVIRTPERIELTARLGEFAETSVRIENPGSDACVLEGIDVRDPNRQFKLDATAVPYTLAGGTHLDLTLRYRPLDMVQDQTGLQLTSDSEVQPLILIPLIGNPLRDEPGCDASSSPNPLHLGVLRPGERRASSVTIVSFQGYCAVTELELLSAHPDLELLLEDLELPMLLAPGETLVVPIRYTASEEPEVSAVVRVAINTQAFPVLQTPIGGSSQADGICITPEHLEGSGQITVSACGDRAITIDDIAMARQQAGVTLSAPTTPLVLNAGQSATIDVTHDGQPVSDQVVITSDDGLRPTVHVPIEAGLKALDVAGGLYFSRSNDSDYGAIMSYPFRAGVQDVLVPSPSTTNCIGCHVASPDDRFVVSEAHRAPFMLAAFDRESGAELILSHPVDDAINVSFNPDPTTEPPYQYVFSSGGDLHIASLTDGYLGVLEGANDPPLIEAYPAWGSRGQIAFVRGEDHAIGPFQMWGALDLLLIDEDGGTPALLAAATDEHSHYYPEFSPDGGHVAFTTSASVAVGATTFAAPDAQLRIVEIDSGAVFDLGAANGTDGASSMPHFSKDGRHIAFTSNRTGGAGGYDVYVATVDLTTGLDEVAIPVTEINTELSEHDPAWSK